MSCPSCQHENPADAQFCNRCGARLELRCGQCERVNPPGSAFCNACGHAFDAATAMRASEPRAYTPRHLAERILKTRSAIGAPPCIASKGP